MPVNSLDHLLRDAMPAPAMSPSLRLHLAQAALSQEFLFPNLRCWARLTIALARWNELNPGKDAKMAFFQEVLEKESVATGAKERRKASKSFEVQMSHACNPEYASASNGLGNDILIRLAAFLSVEPDWLLDGFSRTGAEVWPAWSACYTRQGRHTLRELLLSGLADMVERRSTSWTITQLVCAARPEPVTWNQDDIRINVSNFIHENAGDGPPLSQTLRDVQTYIDRNQLRLDTYLARYQEALRADLAVLVAHWQAGQGVVPVDWSVVEDKDHALRWWVRQVLVAAQRSPPPAPERCSQPAATPTPPFPSPPPTPAP